MPAPRAYTGVCVLANLDSVEPLVNGILQGVDLSAYKLLKLCGVPCTLHFDPRYGLIDAVQIVGR